MNPEIVQMRADLALQRRTVSKLREESIGLIVLIRMQISPYGEDAVLSCDTKKALQLMQRLHQLKTDLTAALANVKALEEALGVDHE